MVKNKVEQELRQLIIDNPELEIVPFCSDEASSMDYAWSVGSLYRCSVDEWCASDLDEERVLVKSRDYSDYADDYIDAYSSDDGDPSDEDIETAYEKLEWKKSILIWIDSL